MDNSISWQFRINNRNLIAFRYYAVTGEFHLSIFGAQLWAYF
jgi:uncharacterized membrane protein YciS (DUF1049 family)